MNPSASFRLPACTTALLLAGLLPSWAGAQTITLTVPYRGATAKQTASTTVEFDASAISGGATITVAGKSVAVPASGCAGLACKVLDATAAGDDIQVTRISGTERAQVMLTYTASFGGNYCAYTGVASSKTFDFTLSGFTFGGATNGYRITSFMSPSDVSCDIPYARVPSQRPSFPAGPIAKLGRLPLNVVLVLDKSGSMSSVVPGSTDVRWNRLKSSVEQFVKVWQVAGAPPAGSATVSSDGNAEDRLGVVFFDSSTIDGSLDGSFFKSRGATDTPWWTPVNTELTARGPGGATSIGGGISRGRTQLNTVAAVTGDTAIVLFTDGEQNTTPCVMREGETIAFNCEPTVPAAAGSRLVLSDAPAVQLAQAAPRGPIFTIGLGEGSGPFADLLEQISQETAGRSRITPTGLAMDTAFVDALVDSLKGSTMSLLARKTGTVAVGSSAGTPLKVFVDDAVHRVVFATRWDDPGSPLIEIRRPDGSVVTGNMQQAGDRIMVASVDLPKEGPSGTWQARIVRGPNSTDRTAAPYHLSAYAVESRLSYRITESPRTGTGTPVKVTAEVGWDGKGITKLPPGAIRVRVERPGVNLGNILFDSKTRGEPGRAEGDQQDPLRAKLDALNAGGKLAQQIAPRPVPGTLEMKHVGLGRYEAKFDPTQIGGQYRFRVDMDWTDKRTGRIKRTETTERQIPVAPSAANTTVNVQQGRGGAVITLTPKDRYGNLVGPGYGNLFNVQVSGATAALPVTDPSVRGIYVIRLNRMSENDPRVRISFRGQRLRDAHLSQLAKASTSLK